MQKFDCIIVYVLEELTLGSEDRYIDYWLMMIDDEGLMMNDYSKKLGEMFGGLELFE